MQALVVSYIYLTCVLLIGSHVKRYGLFTQCRIQEKTCIKIMSVVRLGGLTPLANDPCMYVQCTCMILNVSRYGFIDFKQAIGCCSSAIMVTIQSVIPPVSNALLHFACLHVHHTQHSQVQTYLTSSLTVWSLIEAKIVGM